MGEEHEEFPIENTLTRPPNLTDHLTWQLSMSDASPRIKEIGAFIIGNIDEDGYLRATNEEIAAAGSYEPQEVEKAVERDPVARSDRRRRARPARVPPAPARSSSSRRPARREIVRDHWDEFMQRHFVQIWRRPSAST